MINTKTVVAMCASGLLLGGCGLAETTVSAGAAGASAAQQVEEGQKQQQKVRDALARGGHRHGWHG